MDPTESREEPVFEAASFITTIASETTAPADPKRKPSQTGEELASVIKEACEDAGCTTADIAVRISDADGTEASFQESALAEAQVFKEPGQVLPPLWLPAESAGEVGAAFAPLGMAWAWHAALKGYLPGQRALIHATNSDGLRGAAVLHYREI